MGLCDREGRGGEERRGREKGKDRKEKEKRFNNISFSPLAVLQPPLRHTSMDTPYWAPSPPIDNI